MELTIPEADFSYGVPTKPPTPIDKVVHNYYGETAAMDITQKYNDINKLVLITTNNG